jgi:hypothetical protein
MASPVAGGNGNQNVVGCVTVLKDEPVDDVGEIRVVQFLLIINTILLHSLAQLAFSF